MLQMHAEVSDSPRVIVRPPTPEDLEVSVWVTIRADIRRVINALTITEYMEAWMHMPGTEEFLCRADEEAADNFCFDLYTSDELHTSIHGYCLLSTPDHLMYVWKKTPCEAGRETVVDIHLQASAGQCTLNLKHSGLCTINDSVWHSAMWKRSLENLCRLMEA